MHRLICTFVVRIWFKTRFRMTWPKWYMNSVKNHILTCWEITILESIWEVFHQFHWQLRIFAPNRKTFKFPIWKSLFHCNTGTFWWLIHYNLPCKRNNKWPVNETNQSCLMRKGTLATCGSRSFKWSCTATKKGQRCGYLSEAFSSSLYCVSEQQRLWRDCEGVQACLSLRWSPMW